jgi:hypothetical protein
MTVSGQLVIRDSSLTLAGYLSRFIRKSTNTGAERKTGDLCDDHAWHSVARASSAVEPHLQAIWGSPDISNYPCSHVLAFETQILHRVRSFQNHLASYGHSSEDARAPARSETAKSMMESKSYHT